MIVRQEPSCGTTVGRQDRLCLWPAQPSRGDDGRLSLSCGCKSMCASQVHPFAFSPKSLSISLFLVNLNRCGNFVAAGERGGSSSNPEILVFELSSGRCVSHRPKVTKKIHGKGRYGYGICLKTAVPDTPHPFSRATSRVLAPLPSLPTVSSW